MTMNSENYKRVLVTGGAGFIAHHLIETILDTTDWEVVSLDRLDFSGNLNRLHDIMQKYSPEQKRRVSIVFHDLKSEINSQISNLIGDVDLILHLAAGSHVDRSIDFPMEFVQDNVIGTVNLLNYARTLKNLKKFVYFSTDEVFGPAPSGVIYQERDRYNATNPYSASKAAAEEMCVAYENTYKLPIVITHTMNVFGERQHPEKYIPKAIRYVRDGLTLPIHSNQQKTIAGSRHYIHAKDVADGLMFILNLPIGYDKNEDFGGAKIPKFNLVGPVEIDNLQLARMIASVQNKELNYEMIDFHSSRPGHDLRYALSGDYLKRLGWTPKISLHDRITSVVEWSLNNPKWL
jgi:dTDP-glucose 4,6-dehydratase